MIDFLKRGVTLVLIIISFTAFAAPGTEGEMLINAVMKGDIKAVGRLLDEGEDINYKGGEMQLSVLQTAIFMGKHEIVRLLVKRGVRLDNFERITLPDSVEILPLIDNIKQKNYSMVELLVELGAGIGLTALARDYHISPLLTALEVGDYAIFELLLSKGARPAEIDSRGLSAFTYALKKGDAKALKLLVSRGFYENYRWVQSRAGLTIWSNSSPKAKKIGDLPPATRIVLLDEDPDELVIGGVKGRWHKVIWEGKVGWLFVDNLGLHAPVDIGKILLPHLWGYRFEESEPEQLIRFFEDYSFVIYNIHNDYYEVDKEGRWVYDIRANNLHLVFKEHYPGLESQENIYKELSYETESEKLILNSYEGNYFTYDLHKSSISLRHFEKARIVRKEIVKDEYFGSDYNDDYGGYSDDEQYIPYDDGYGEDSYNY